MNFAMEAVRATLTRPIAFEAGVGETLSTKKEQWHRKGGMWNPHTI